MFAPMEFEWYLTHNFYTYQTLRTMLREIRETADLLTVNYDDPALSTVKAKFPAGYIDDTTDEFITGDHVMRDCRFVIADFYRCFAARLSSMMGNNPSTNLISIMGP